MPSNPPATGNRADAFFRRAWRPAAVVVAGLLTVAACSQPSHRASQTAPWPSSSRTATAPGATSPSQAAPSRTPRPATSTPTHAAPRPTPAKPKPAPTTFTVHTSFKMPGSVPHMPWPRTGQATIAVSGIGAIGHSGSNSSMPTASMAKAMTAYIVLRDHPLRGSDQGPTLHVTRAEAAALPHERATAQSTIPVRSGEALTERQALNALMLASANNVARILARWDAGSVTAFLNKMNATAKQLGMAHTHYTDPSGWHASTVSTPSDQIRLASAAMGMSSFAKVVSTQNAVVPLAGHIHNYNALLGSDGVVGVKTGSMSASGGCLMFAARITVSGHPVTIVGTVMGQHSGSMGILHTAFASSRTLLRTFERSLTPYTVVRAGQVVGYVGPAHTPVRAAKTVTVVGWRGMSVPGTIHATVQPTTAKGATVGTLQVGGFAPVPVTKG